MKLTKFEELSLNEKNKISGGNTPKVCSCVCGCNDSTNTGANTMNGEKNVDRSH